MDKLNTSYQLRALSQEERLTARESAKTAIVKLAGERPSRQDYNRHTESEYPLFITRLILSLCLIALVVAFVPSF